MPSKTKLIQKSATTHHDWFDELHLKSHVYQRIARTYSNFIQGKIERGSKHIVVP